MWHYFPSVNIQEWKIVRTSSSWCWSYSTDFPYPTIGHSFCPECQDGEREGKQRRLDYYHGVTNFWTIWSIIFHTENIIFHSQFHGMKFSLYISRHESIHWSFTAWLVSRHEWKFFVLEWIRRFTPWKLKFTHRDREKFSRFSVKSISPLFAWRVTNMERGIMSQSRRTGNQHRKI